jgi:bifunctional UDP-N-acetylglucosamine pyrophosphorylase / glucosamine-1-phosphate N-acetyltransferase
MTARKSTAPKRANPKPARSAPLSVAVLAAGQGKRMHSELPKVLQPLAGVPLLWHVLELAASLAPEAIHVVYGYGGERVREACADADERLPASAPLQWVRQEQQLGTGHALAQALPRIPEQHQVLVLYGDVPLLRAETLRALMTLAAPRGMALLTAMVADPTGYGRIVRERRGTLRRIVEEADASPRERRLREISTGVMLAPARQLRRYLAQLAPRNAQREYYLTDVAALARRAGMRVQTLLADDVNEILGVNDKQQLAAAEAEYRGRRARELMQRGVTITDPGRIDIYGAVSVGRDVLLDVNVALQGPVQLGDGVQVGRNCIIKNSSIGAGTLLYANCVVSDADIGADCRIGPFTHLRPGAHIAATAHLGNFVEIKNSTIGAGSKVNHLSYVGDSDVGSGVNIGAGTITCNYDGVTKWRTRIGDGAFIGSGTMLVAPVSIGAGATIGAGSTITSDAPADKLTLARSRQLTIEEWERPRARAVKA